MPLIDTLAVIQQNLTLYIYPLWLIFGIIGCLLNLIVFSRPQLRRTSFSIYFFTASFDHLLTLIIGIGPSIYSLNHPDPQIQSLSFCKVRGYLLQICLMLSRWFVVFACIDRYALTSESVRLRNFATNKIAYRVTVVILIIWSIIISHRLIFYEIQGNICGIVKNMGAALYHSAYVIIAGGILPAMIIIICAYFIGRNLTRKRQRRALLFTPQRVVSSLDQQVLKILFIQIICYIIFIIPQLCNLLFNTVSITDPGRSEDHLAVEQFVSFIAELMLYLFPVTSFYLYTLTSRTFSKELKKFFCSMLIPCFGNQIAPLLNSSVVIYHVQNTRLVRPKMVSRIVN